MDISTVTRNSLIDYICDENQSKNEILRIILKGQDVVYDSNLKDDTKDKQLVSSQSPRQ